VFDPVFNGHWEFSGEFLINAFGRLTFTRHQVVSRSAVEWALDKPEKYVRKAPSTGRQRSSTTARPGRVPRGALTIRLRLPYGAANGSTGLVAPAGGCAAPAPAAGSNWMVPPCSKVRPSWIWKFLSTKKAL
jgi:hypothetical protein